MLGWLVVFLHPASGLLLAIRSLMSSSRLHLLLLRGALALADVSLLVLCRA
jgi:hypothetical protein